MGFIDRLDWITVALVCATLGLAPFTPEPHVVEKLRMLASGTLSRPIDIFDLVMHGLPWAVLVLKALRTFRKTQ
jgi:hypothetical protein